MKASDKQKFEGEELVEAGIVRRAFGIRGQLMVDWNNGSSPVPVGSGNIYMRAGREGAIEKFKIVKDHRHGNHNIVNLENLESRTDAEKYKSSKLWIEEKNLAELEDGEYYSYQLIEIRVETIQGKYLGEIKEIFSTGSNDVYVVKDGENEILIPAIEDVVKEIDIEKKLMKIDLIEGLV